MKSSVLRFVLLVGVLAIFAVPATAQYPGCQTCYAEGGGELGGLWCGDPPDNSWGNETCNVEQINQTWICRARGPMCYYMDVEG